MPRPPMRPQPRPMFNEQISELEDGPRVGAGRDAVALDAAPQRRSRTAAQRPMAAAEEMASPAPAERREMASQPDSAMPQGGSGGAGSLSQMMLYGSTLYVLS